jgi:outer membrane protein assembly factor BamA
MRRVWDMNNANVGAWVLLGLLCGGGARGEDIKPPDPSGNAPAPGGNQPIQPSEGWLQKWLNPKSAPFIPVPEIATDPDSGTTLGLLAVYLKTDANNEISQIVAPDVLHNPNFGYGMHARIYSFASDDKQWSLVGGIKERVEREFDAEYQVGRARLENWSMSFSAIYDKDGTPRFYGIGNRTHSGAETTFTNNQELGQVNIGFNLSHAWQILYTGRLQVVEVEPGTIDGVVSIEKRFPTLDGLNTNKMFRNRLSVIYDTRDDLTVPSHGVQLIGYTGIASANGLFNNSMYSEAGFDARGYWPMFTKTVLAAHTALRYLPSMGDVPFWALSALGGGQSDVGGQQALRGFGNGRFYGRDSFATTVELRQTVMNFNAAGTTVDLEVAPFVDVGRVFGRNDTFPLGSLHQVYGVGFRGIAKPFVVGHVDLGYGSEGLAVFTGLNYPF